MRHEEWFKHRDDRVKGINRNLLDPVMAHRLPFLGAGFGQSSIFDFVQGITVVARDKPHQDARLDMEAKAKKLLDRAA